jgi:quercetin dioxygenase-like cupin family protein
MAKRHIENSNSYNVTWHEWDLPLLGKNIGRRLLTDDPENGAFTAVVELPAQLDSKNVLACTSEFQIFVLTGELKFDDIVMQSGAYCYYPPNSPHGRWRTTSRTSFLMICEKEPIFFVPESIDPLKDSVRYIDSWNLEWKNPLDVSDPSNLYRQGLMVKILRQHPITGASTHLAGLLPGWFAKGLEVHPIYEENFCLSGDVNIAIVDGAPGYTMTKGTYLCRPPQIPHGPISSKNGNVNFCYTPGKLGIDYQECDDDERLIFDHLRTYPWN